MARRDYEDWAPAQGSPGCECLTGQARQRTRKMAATETVAAIRLGPAQQGNERQPSEAEVLLNMPSSLPPSRVAPAMMAIAISATSRPYSTAEAPRSVRAIAVRRMRT